jgi:hypothetical protein
MEKSQNELQQETSEADKEVINRELDEMLIKLFTKWRDNKCDLKNEDAQLEAFIEIVSIRLTDLLEEKGAVL